MSEISAVRMPKWGLSMQEGAIVGWLKRIGDPIIAGEDLVEIETSKITNVCESPAQGVLRRILANDGETLDVGALIGVLAAPDVDEAEIDRYVAEFKAQTRDGKDGDEGGALSRLSMVDVGGGAYRISEAGPATGPPVVLLHGFAGDLNNWLFNVDALADRAHVLAMDLPGHGSSSKSVGDGSLAELAGIVAQVMDAKALAHAHLVGHSLGAAVAMRLAADRPDLVASLVLIAPAGLPGARVSTAFLDGVVEAERARDLKRVLELLVADPGLVSKDMVDDVMKFKRLDGAQAALALLRDRMVSGDDARALEETLTRLPPVHIIASKADKIVGVPDVSRLLPEWRVSWIEGAGHMPHLEKAAEVNALLLQAIA